MFSETYHQWSLAKDNDNLPDTWYGVHYCPVGASLVGAVTVAVLESASDREQHPKIMFTHIKYRIVRGY